MTTENYDLALKAFDETGSNSQFNASRRDALKTELLSKRQDWEGLFNVTSGILLKEG